MPLYQSHKKVWALKIAAIEREKLPTFLGATCKGCFVLKNACGSCERCKWELSHPQPMATFLTPAEKSYFPFEVSAEFISKHKPEVGGYFVQYAGRL